jgi:hypothetical protein
VPQIAKQLNIGQDSVSRIEQRSDILLSRMRSYVQAMGSSLDLVASFPDRGRVIIRSLEDLAPARKKAFKKKHVVHAGLNGKRAPKRPVVARAAAKKSSTR